jgi:plastocyanin
MRELAFSLCLFFSANVFAHEISGTVEVLLKGGKKKTDLTTVVVYLSQSKESKIPDSALKNNYSMVTKNKQFTPQVLAVPVGATVDFPNYDAIFHNLFSVSAPNKFDLGLYKGGDSRTNTFSSPGIVRVFCNVHPQMTATIVVTDTPYFTNSDKDGNFSLGDIPNGSYEVTAYTEEGQASSKIEMNNAAVKLSLTVDASKYKKLPHKNKDGKDYPSDTNASY